MVDDRQPVRISAQPAGPSNKPPSGCRRRPRGNSSGFLAQASTAVPAPPLWITSPGWPRTGPRPARNRPLAARGRDVGLHRERPPGPGFRPPYGPLQPGVPRLAASTTVRPALASATAKPTPMPLLAPVTNCHLPGQETGPSTEMSLSPPPNDHPRSLVGKYPLVQPRRARLSAPPRPPGLNAGDVAGHERTPVNRPVQSLSWPDVPGLTLRLPAKKSPSI